MSFRNLSILLFVAVGCIHNAQAYPAYPAAPDSTSNHGCNFRADTATSTTPPKPSATGADASGKGAAGTGSILADKPNPADLKAAPAATKAPGTMQADLVEACAPLLKDGKLVAGADAPKKQPTPAIPPLSRAGRNSLHLQSLPLSRAEAERKVERRAEKLPQAKIPSWVRRLHYLEPRCPQPPFRLSFRSLSDGCSVDKRESYSFRVITNFNHFKILPRCDPF
ncbi:hypothetical protein PSTT_16590 [Puccinia striiformis]|uniref:Uncharacterized protein n=1 Tax=Puccinia striiformis TaxID=27350 RepID=A0A2S4UC43_9BASI|nr:hypothetical protein PSTT_16590 [Puccinia striiformis]